jgi:hypothetical protein
MLTIDTIAELLKDYVGGEDIPEDAMPIKLMLKPTEQGKLAIEMVSDTWREGLDPLMINFKIKRVYGL